MTTDMTYRIFIDGAAGTTGLQVADRLARHPGVTAHTLDDAKRKDDNARREMMAASDLTILCLPDDAARDVASAADHDVKVIDASSAHRTSPGWVYGFPELMSGQRAAIAGANRISNPGCYPTGFLSLVRPLMDSGLLGSDALLSIAAISGYSGGGNAMIARHADAALPAFGIYGTGMAHKHIPEMIAYSGLKSAPVFMPSVGNFYAGMLVNLPLHAAHLSKSVSAQDIHQVLAAHYEGEHFVRMGAASAGDQAALEDGLLAAERLWNANHLELFVFASPDESQFWLVARLDNLGKGASGAAVQNMNIALGLDEKTGLEDG